MSKITLWITIQFGDLMDWLFLDDEPHGSEPDVLPVSDKPDRSCFRTLISQRAAAFLA
jgi:hypothetical protein